MRAFPLRGEYEKLQHVNLPGSSGTQTSQIIWMTAFKPLTLHERRKERGRERERKEATGI